MKTYLQMDGDRLVEYVEKREYDAVVLALHDMTNLLDSEKSTRNHMIKRGAELERELNAAKELIREIRDNEVNAVDEATKFLRDYPINEHNKCK
jgi:hypothetical protein